MTKLKNINDAIMSLNENDLPPAGKNTRVVLAPYLHMEVCPYSYFW